MLATSVGFSVDSVEWPWKEAFTSLVIYLSLCIDAISVWACLKGFILRVTRMLLAGSLAMLWGELDILQVLKRSRIQCLGEATVMESSSHTGFLSCTLVPSQCPPLPPMPRAEHTEGSEVAR